MQVAVLKLHRLLCNRQRQHRLHTSHPVLFEVIVIFVFIQCDFFCNVDMVAYFVISLPRA